MQLLWYAHCIVLVQLRRRWRWFSELHLIIYVLVDICLITVRIIEHATWNKHEYS